jgi:hypothetical protein
VIYLGATARSVTDTFSLKGNIGQTAWLFDCVRLWRQWLDGITLNEEALAWIAAAVKDSPRAHGIDLWNNARLRTALQQRFGIEYSRGYVWEIATRAGVATILSRRRN